MAVPAETAVEVRMPRLSDSMEEGTIVGWLIGGGQAVRENEELVEIETDKATVVYEAPASGVLVIMAPEGSTVAVGAVIAHLANSAGPALTADTAQSDTGPEVADPVQPVRVSSRMTERLIADEGNGQAPVSASPVARRLAAERGIDLALISGSGPGGRVLKEDVLRVEPSTSSGPDLGPDEVSTSGSAAAIEAIGTSAKGQSVRGSLTRSQRLVARRMASAKATIPEYSVSTSVDMQAAMAMRPQLATLLSPNPSVNDLVVAATARTLRNNPRLNASYDDGEILFHGRINVGIAVAVEDELLVPTIYDADEKSLASIAAESRELAQRAAAGTLTPAELSGGTFTVTNLGMFGVTSFHPIIYPPQAAILAVGAVTPHDQDQQRMMLTVVCDHRIVYGAHAARFLADLRSLLEAPVAILAERTDGPS